MTDTATHTEKKLFAQIATGDDTAFEQFYNLHWNKIYSLALAYLKSQQLAQDIVQDVFLKLWTKREKLSEVTDPDSFIYIMGRNEVLNALKKKVRLTFIDDEKENDLPDDLLLPQQLDLKELGSQINKAIDKLPAQQKKILRLSREKGLSHEQIAEQLGIEKVTVKNHIVRALHSLRQQLGLKGNSLLFWYLLAEWFGT